MKFLGRFIFKVCFFMVVAALASITAMPCFVEWCLYEDGYFLKCVLAFLVFFGITEIVFRPRREKNL